MNVLLYWPLGMFGFLAFPETRPKVLAAAAPIAIGFTLSCSMEILQLFDAWRAISGLDVVSNTAGSIFGVACGILFASDLRSIGRSLQTIRCHQRGSLLLIISLAIRELLPFFPDYSPYRVWHKLIALLTVTGSSVGVFSTSLIEWLVVARLVEAAIEPPWVSGIYLALLALIPAKIFVLGRITDGMELAGGAAAYFIWHYGLRKSDRRSGWLAILFWGLMVIRGLAPFHFTGGAMPFFGKLFAYGTLVWLLRDSGWLMRYAAAGAAATVAAVEAAQMYLPGRVPAAADPLLVLLLAGILALVDRPNDSPGGRSICAGSDSFPR